VNPWKLAAAFTTSLLGLYVGTKMVMGPTLAHDGSEGPGLSTVDRNSLYPPFRARFELVEAEMEALGYPLEIRGAYRDSVRQQYYFNKRYSQIDPSAGMVGMHTATSALGTPEALAVDVNWKGHNVNKEEGAYAQFFITLLAVSRKHGLTTGAAWSQRGRWAKYGIGWDPGHIEPRGFTTAQLRKGARPWV